MTRPAPPSARHTDVVAADGVRLHLVAIAREGPLAVVLVPGFSCSWDKPFVQRVAGWLAEYAGVVTVDLRGHGRSAGRSTLGAQEVLDVDAAVAVARRSYEQVVTLGFSMGGGSVLRHAALLGERTAEPVDAVVAVSAASRWWRTETRPMRRLHLLAGTGPGRAVTRLALRTRVDRGAAGDPPTPPVALVDRIAPTPLLIVHGETDPYLTTDNARELHAAVGEPKELWLLPEYGHAELAVDLALAARLGGHLPALVARGSP
ncbi:MAG: alpha/beta hydrolase, partial [Mycobacteriales bacterium]